MKKIRIYSLNVATLLISGLFVAAVPVAAQDGVSGGGSNNPETSSSTTEVHRSGETTPTTVATTETEQTTTSDTGQTEHHKKAPKSLEDHKKACEAHKQGLTNKFSHIVANSQRIQTRITEVFNKAKAYQTAHNLQPADFSSLVTAAQSAGDTSAASIDALKAVTPTMDCNNISVASDVAKFKEAAATTRHDLKAYRTAVKAVVKSLETAKNTEGSNQ